MKQLSLALFLVFISISTISSKLFKTKTRIKKSQQNPFHAELLRQGNNTMSDVGSSSISSWVCSKEGVILKSSATAVKYILTNKIEGKCVRIDVDFMGLPWVINDKGNVYRLQKIVDDSLVWHLVHKAGGSVPKAVDIGCGQYKSTTCYIAVKDGKKAYMYNGNKFVEEDDFDARSKILRLDVGSGRTGDELAVVNEDGNILQLARNKAPNSLGFKGNDVSVGYNNDIYVTNGNGISFKSKCSQFFTRIHDISASQISVGNTLWAIGLDSFTYNGTLNSYVDGC